MTVDSVTEVRRRLAAVEDRLREAADATARLRNDLVWLTSRGEGLKP